MRSLTACPDHRTDARRQRLNALGDRRLVKHGPRRSRIDRAAHAPRCREVRPGRRRARGRPIRAPSVPQDEPGLYCLAQPDRVGEQQPRGAADRGENRLELIRPQLDRRVRRRPQTQPAAGPDDGRQRGGAGQRAGGRQRSLRSPRGRGRSNGSITRRRSPAFDRSRPSSVSSTLASKGCARVKAHVSPRTSSSAPASKREGTPRRLQTCGRFGRRDRRLLRRARFRHRSFCDRLA